MFALNTTGAEWAVLAAALLPIVCAGIAKSGMFKTPRREGGYDNQLPRQWLAQQSDWRARANAAQANSFEAFPFFAAAVIIATLHKADPTLLNTVAWLYVAVRVGYVYAYVSNRASLRSLLWLLGMAINTGLLFIAP